jgi:GT2 family glycosyltransferase
MTPQQQTCVMIPVYGESDYLIRCVQSILKFTPQEIPIYICDDASPTRDTRNFLESQKITTSRIHFIRREENQGFVTNCNMFFSEMKDSNIALVNSDVIVSTGWLQSLLEPLKRFSNVATVTAMSNNGSIATVKLGLENLPQLDEEALEKLNSQLVSNPQPENSEIPVGVGHCMLITAKALTIVGLFDKVFSPGYGEEVDFSISATQYGLQHYLANTVVTHFGSKTFGDKSPLLTLQHNKLLNQKHPGYLEYIGNFRGEMTQVESMFMNVLCKYRGTRILIDARLMNPVRTGTSRVLENTILALSNNPHLKISVLLQQSNTDFWKDKFPSEVKLVLKNEIKDMGLQFEILYCPNQISEQGTMYEYKFWARRIVILQMDFIAFSNWKYFHSVPSYNSYQNATYETYAKSDSVVYLSSYVKETAEQIFNRACQNDRVINCGVDHFAQVEKKEFQPNRILVIGVGFTHKNQLYAAKLLALLETRLPGTKLVFVGAKPTFGFDQEFLKLITNTSSESSIEYHGWVSDNELKEQICKAQLVLLPTLSEGFGLIPFEVAKMNRATLFNLNSSLSEFFTGIPSRLEFSLAADADTISKLLTDKNAYESQLSFIRKTSENFTWEKVGVALGEVFENVIRVKRFDQEFLSKMPANPDFSLMFIKFIGSRKLILRLFPYSSNRREKLIEVVKRRIHLFNH